jgi:hypothetical protein
MDEELVKILKSTAVPVVVVTVVLFALSRGCSHKSPAPATETTVSVTPQASAPVATTSTAEQGVLPDGLTEDVARYAIESDQTFRNGETVTVSRNASDEVLSKLADLGVVAMTPYSNGRRVAYLTPRAAEQPGFYDLGGSWQFTGATRKVISFGAETPVTAGPGRYNVSFNWEQKATPVGEATGIQTSQRKGLALFSVSNDHWTLLDLSFGGEARYAGWNVSQ